MKSDRYWQVMPKPKSRQNPVSFLITCREKDLRVYTQKYISPTHSGATSTRACFCGLNTWQLEREIHLNLTAMSHSNEYDIFHKWLIESKKTGRIGDRFDWCALPAVAPQVGRVQDSRRSEWGCTGWITPDRTPFYLRGSETEGSDNLTTTTFWAAWTTIHYLLDGFWLVETSSKA